MGITFHTLTGMTIAATFAASVHTSPGHFPSLSVSWSYGILFLVCLLSHSLLDLLPHGYPISLKYDGIVACAGIVWVWVQGNPEWRRLIVVCLAGVLLPDILDWTPTMINLYFKTSWPRYPLPQAVNAAFGTAFSSSPLCPWHWPRYCGGIYDGSRQITSFVWHAVVVFLCLLGLFRYGHALL